MPLTRATGRALLMVFVFAALTLAPGAQHARVVVGGGEHLVARLQVEAELDGLEALAGVAGDRHLLGVAPELAGEAAAHRLDLRLEELPERQGLLQELLAKRVRRESWALRHRQLVA